MNQLDVAKVIHTLRDLPALPSIVFDLIESFEHDQVDVATLAEKMSRDQALAAKTLRLANSSFYGLAAKVKTVKQAIVVLGFDGARALAIASGVIGGFGDSRCARLDIADFWRHSIAVALCAKNLARQSRHPHLNQDHAFIAGLLHDIGRLVLASRFPAQYAEAVAWSDLHDQPLLRAELHVLGVDHQRTGQLLAEAWKFPPLIQRAIGQHHTPHKADLDNISGIVHVADALAQALDLGCGAHAAVPVLVDAAWDALGLGPEQLREVCRITEGQFEEACRLIM